MIRDGGEGRRPPLPGPVGRRAERLPSASNRPVAVLALALCAVGLGALVHEAQERRATGGGYRVPFSAAGAEAVAPDGSTWSAASLRRPTVLLYVVWSCSHCAAELREWTTRLSGGAPGPATDFRIVAPESPPYGAVPPGVRPLLLVDRDGSTARSLGADLVPTTAYLVPGGRVVARTRGRASTEEVRRGLRRLAEAGSRGAGR